MMDRKVILFVLPWLPFPLKSGGHQAVFNGLMAVKDDYRIIITYQESYEISNEENKKRLIEILGCATLVLPFKKNKEQSSQPVKFKTRVHRVLRSLLPYQKKTEVTNRVSSSFLAWSSEIQMPSKTYVEHVLSIIEQYHVDIVQCEMIRNASLVYGLPLNVIKVFVHHELGFVRRSLESLLVIEDETEKQMYLKYAKAKEIGTLDLYDAVITLSQTDTDKLKQVGIATRIYTSFAVVDTKPIQTVYKGKGNKLSFVGPSSSPPNVVAVKWFLGNCWNVLQSEGDYQLQIIGYWDESLRNEIVACYKNVFFTGFVEELSVVLKDTILIVPITIGSGIRMKILEAAAIGIPIVSTTIGAEGLPFVNEMHCMIADTPKSFIESIKKLQDEDLCARLVVNARMKMEEGYSFEVFKQNRLEIYSQIQDY